MVLSVIVEQVSYPQGWESHAAPVATLFEALGPSALWWLAGAILLGLGFAFSRRRPVLAIGLAAAAAFVLAVAADGLVDDAYIQFRFAANLAAGHGPVFNPGERIEGASGGSWIGVLAAMGLLTGLGPAVTGRVLSLILAPVSVVLAGATGTRIAGASGPAMALIWAALPTTSLYAATGLETTAYVVGLWLIAWNVARESWPGAAIGAFLIATVRPEVFGFVVLVLPFWRRLNRTARAAAFAGLIAVLIITAFRLLFYGSPLPNSAVVKGLSGAASVWLGLRYLGNGLLEWWPLLLGLPALAHRYRSLAPAILPVAAWLIVVVARGGDWMPGSRYLLPLLVLLVLAIGLTPRRLCLSATAIMILVSLVRMVPLEEPGAFRPGDLWRAMAKHRVQSRWWEAVGTWLGEEFQSQTLIAVGPAGAIPYASNLPTFDLYGLNTRVTRTGGSLPGHTLWGLLDAIAANSDVVYPGTPVPQEGGRSALMVEARAQAEKFPALGERYRPVLLTHPPDYGLDVAQDLIWVRVGLPIRGQTES